MVGHVWLDLNIFLGLDQYGSGSESDDDAGEQIELQQASGSDDSTGIDGHVNTFIYIQMIVL